MSNEFPSTDLVQHMILEGFTMPVIFHGFINDWDMLSWTLDIWAEKFDNKSLTFRTGDRKSTMSPQWEANSENMNLTLREFIELESDIKRKNEESAKWMYFDYKYMNEWFSDQIDVLNAVTWKNFGFPEKRGDESTLWIGNNGAHTPCHMDTYGCNLVAQVHGRKQWILFPPEKACMQPTRIPYEESSVYSNINFYSPKPNLADDLEEAFVVTLNPGDVLYVPWHWWHYVENIDIAISINTWIPLPSDDESRLEEALIRFFISQVCKDLPEEEQLMILNPNEADLVEYPLSISAEQIDTCKQKCRCNNKEENDQHVIKKLKMDDVDDQHSSHFKLNEQEFLRKYKDIIKPVPKYTLKELKMLFEEKRKHFLLQNIQTAETNTNYNRIQSIINAFCQPDVISKVKNNILQQT